MQLESQLENEKARLNSLINASNSPVFELLKNRISIEIKKIEDRIYDNQKKGKASQFKCENS